MKKTLQGFIFWTIAIALIIAMLGIGQALANLITMKQIILITYVVLGYSIIYIFKN